MPNNTMNIILATVLLGLWLLAMVVLLLRAIKNKKAPGKTVEAQVVHKQIVESVSKYAGNGKREQYVVVFSVDGRKKSFYVSSFSYAGYRIGEKGMLTYQGDKLIGFR
ncbi:MAG: DUF2500 domain-containing protein [Ruminococcaceae bacterium]|nr:DUF2500 domain-containing protein [Oscillospiraceae bacterium]